MNGRLIRTALGVMLGLGLVAPAAPDAGQNAPVKIDVSALGPKVGDPVPDFRLPDQLGTTRTLDSLMGPKGLMLVFSRSADWCPYCKTQMIELQSRAATLRAEGLGLAVITYDAPAVLADFAGRRGIEYPLLSDAGSATIKAYGILNTAGEPGTRNFGIPHPGTFIVDRRKIVTARFFEDAYQERNTVAGILLKLGGGGQEVSARRITTEHVEFSY
jgi:peroxiredoxin